MNPAAGRAGWIAVTMLLALGALLAPLAPAHALDWEPALARTEPWRAVTAAWVHWSMRHLVANLAGLALVCALGLALGASARMACAWAAAWPLTQAAFLLQPELAHYGGLSGVLHAGVAVCAVAALRAGERRARAIGALLLLGLVAKIALEAPWAGALRTTAGLDVPVAPLAHAAGAVFGVLLAALLGARPALRYDGPMKEPSR